MQITLNAEAKTVFLQFDQITPAVMKGVEWGNLEANVQIFKEKDKQILDYRGKTGVTYNRTKKDKAGNNIKHLKGKKKGQDVIFKVTRSAAGETPTEETGAYRASFEFNDRGAQGFIWGTTSPYGGYLEYGTGKMSPRNALTNIFNAVSGNLVNIYEKQIARASRLLK